MSQVSDLVKYVKVNYLKCTPMLLNNQDQGAPNVYLDLITIDQARGYKGYCGIAAEANGL